MSEPNRNFQPQKSSDQSILNKSFDRDFQIQAVELGGYNPDTDEIKRVIVDEEGRLIVSVDSSLPTTLTPGSSVLEYASVSTIPDNSLTTILVHAVGVAPLLLDGVIATGTVDAEYIILVNNQVKIRYRTAEQDRTVNIKFETPQKFIVGSVIAIKVIHYNTANTADFDATFIGHKD